MFLQGNLAFIALAIVNIKWIFISIIIFTVGIFILRWYARKRHKSYEKVWDRTLKTSFEVNIVWLFFSIYTHILLNFVFPESIFFDLIVSIINIFIGTILVMFIYKKKFAESVLCVAIVQSILFVIVLLLWFVFYFISIPPYIFLFIILVGLSNTFVLTALGLIWGFLIGVTLAIMRVYGGKELGWISSGYEKLFRGVPLLVLIYFFAYGIPYMQPLESIVLALALRSGAYQSQILRGAILSVNPGQMDAAYTLGMNRFKAFRYVIMPQAFRLAVPSWSNEYAIVIKDTSFAYEVGIIEMTRAAIYVSVSFKELWSLSFGVVAITYFLFTFPITKFFGERQTKKLKKLGMGGG